MSAPYRLFGGELSPYSVKVRSYLRYKGLAHDWIVRSGAREEEFRRLAKLPLIPLLVTPEGESLQDSTPIIVELERRHPEPPLDPPDGARAFLSALIEEYADEWGNKAMFHYRWTYEDDQRSAAERICAETMPDMSDQERARVADMIRRRMVDRLFFVGSHEGTHDIIEGSFRRLLAILDSHLEHRPYMFGGRPCLADLGLFGQLYQLLSDPTPGTYLRRRHPRLVGYIDRMLEPKALGPFEPLKALEPTLKPLLCDEIAGYFLPWSEANARAIAEGQERFSVVLRGAVFSQTPQKYHAKSLSALRARYGALKGDPELSTLLADTGCRPWLVEG